MRIRSYIQKLLFIFCIVSPHILFASPFVYVTNNSTVSVIDAATNMVIATIVTGTISYNGIAVSTDNRTVYVSCFNNTIKRIDVATNTLLTPDITLPLRPRSLAVHPDGKYLYATAKDGYVYKINLMTNMLETTISGFNQPYEIAIAPDGLTAYISDSEAGGQVVPINLTTNTLGTPVSVQGSLWISIDSIGKYAYVSRSLLSNVIQLDLTTPLAPTITNTIPITSLTSYGNAISPNNATLYASGANSNNLTPIDITNPLIPVVAYSVDTETLPAGIAITKDGQYIYVANDTSESVSVFDVSNPLAPYLVNTIEVGDGAFGIAIAYEPPYDYPTPTPPSQVRGAIRNNIFLDKTEFVLQITWNPSTSDDVVSYNMYNGDTIIANILATDPLSFCTLTCCNSDDTYFITAVDSDGNESEKTPVIIQ